MSKVTVAANATLVAATLVFVPGALRADEIAYTSFEEAPVFPNVQYVDTLGADTDHPLTNNPDQPYVEYVGAGGELGFTAFYTNTRNDVGLTEGDFVGVNDFVGTVGAYPDGLQGYQIGDADGLMTVTLDAIDLTGFENVALTVDVFVTETGWETDSPAADRVRVWVEVDGGNFIDLLNSGGNDIDDQGIEGVWNTYAADLNGYSTVTLKFEVDSNASTEVVYFDNVHVNGDPVQQDEFTLLPPVPGEAGVENVFATTDGVPGSTVYFVYGFRSGSTPVPGCPGLVVDITSPTIAGSAVTDGNGDAVFSRFVPGNADGVTVLIQAVDVANCDATHMVSEEF